MPTAAVTVPPARRVGRPGATARRVALAIALGVTAASTSAGAQARPVNAEISVSPDQPAPGTDVTVGVFVIGCPPDQFTVEAYLTSSDGATQSAALVARTQARITLLWGARAELTLPAAIEGFYGIRVQCGSFRPPLQAMANTTFAVGENLTRLSTAVPAEVPVGGTVNYLGNGCPGAVVDYDIVQAERRQAPFEPDGSLPVDAAGDWGGEIVLPTTLVAGSADIRARCAIVNQYGETVYLYYQLPGGLTVTDR